MPTLPVPPRIPGLPDPLRRIAVPEDLDAVTLVSDREDPHAAGNSHRRVQGVWRAVQALYRTGVHPAIAVCVRHHGEVVLDRTIGHARGNGPQDGPDVPKVLATPETPFVIFSAAKAVTATLAHVLDERGAFHVGDRVCDYIPEFGRHGKDAITIEHVLSHRAGVPNLPAEVLDLDNLGDDELLLQVMCDAKPRTRPGKLLAYHAVSGGFILAELVKRTTGKPIAEVLREELLDPLGFTWGGYGVRPADLDQVALSYPTGLPPLPPVSTVLERALGPKPDDVTRMSNDPRFLTGVIPAANVVTTANELSRFFELLLRGGELDGTRVFDPRTIRRAVVERAYREFDLTLGAPVRHGAGFMLGAEVLSLFGPDTEQAFGHLGYTNVLAWADPERDLSVGLITSGKPVVHHGLPNLWLVTREIGRIAPRAR